MTYRAVVVERDEDGATRAGVQDLSADRLPEGEVTVAIDYSALNYKDGLCLGTGGGLVRAYPHVPGIDFAGRVESSENPKFRQGDKVIVTGWRVGENRWGGYAQRTRVPAEFLVALPEALSTWDAMALGTAGFTAMLAVITLERHGLTPGMGEVLVTGAAGGVGSVATTLLAELGYEVAAVTGRPETRDYLLGLGAKRVVARSDLSETVRRPLESETWAACVDSVGGAMLARVLGQMKYGGSVAAVGLAGGADLPATVIPFLLRGVSLLGIDSVMCPLPRREEVWVRLAQAMPKEKLATLAQTVPLEQVVLLGKDILGGGVRGRIVVDVNA